MSFTLLLTSAGGELTPQVIRYIKASERHDIRVIAVDMRTDVPARHLADGFATVPAGNARDYASRVAEIVREEGVDLVLPCSDEEALSLARERHLIETDGCRLACVDYETLAIFSDKARCYEALAGMGLPVPRWRKAETVEALRQAIDALLAERSALVAKPAVARGGRNVFVIRKALSEARTRDGGRELHLPPAQVETHVLPALAEQLPAIVMERLREPVHDLDMLAWQGRASRIVPRRRVDSAAPNAGHLFLDSEVLYKLGAKLIEGFNLTWLYDCDLMFDDDGQPQILEINPRPSGSIAVSICAGVPLIDDLVSLAKGEAMADVPSPAGKIVLPYKALMTLPA